MNNNPLNTGPEKIFKFLVDPDNTVKTHNTQPPCMNDLNPYLLFIMKRS